MSLYQLLTTPNFNEADKEALIKAIDYQNQYAVEPTLYAKLLKYAAEAFWPTGQHFVLSKEKIEWLIEQFSDECQNNAHYEKFKKDNFNFLTFVWHNIASNHTKEVCDIFYKYVALNESHAWQIAYESLELMSYSEYCEFDDSDNSEPAKIDVFSWVMEKACSQHLSIEFFINVAHHIVKTETQEKAFPIFFQSLHQITHQDEAFKNEFNNNITKYKIKTKYANLSSSEFETFKIEWEKTEQLNQYYQLNEIIEDPLKPRKQLKI